MDVGMKNVKAYLDVANLLAISHPENWIQIFGNMVSNVHMKDFDSNIGNINGFRNLLKGSVNWSSVLKLLRNAGYGGYLTVECPPSFNPSLKSPTLQDVFNNAEENCKALDKIMKEV
jgi:hexulose-6-phosphate isomerase